MTLEFETMEGVNGWKLEIYPDEMIQQWENGFKNLDIPPFGLPLPKWKKLLKKIPFSEHNKNLMFQLGQLLHSWEQNTKYPKKAAPYIKAYDEVWRKYYE